jgi:hypothetical protein
MLSHDESHERKRRRRHFGKALRFGKRLWAFQHLIGNDVFF